MNSGNESNSSLLCPGCCNIQAFCNMAPCLLAKYSDLASCSKICYWWTHKDINPKTVVKWVNTIHFLARGRTEKLVTDISRGFNMC